MKKLIYYAVVFVAIFIACSTKKRSTSIDIKLLTGRYGDNIYGRDSIFVNTDKSYKHTYYRKDGIIMSQTGTWHFKPAIGDIFFEGFVFYNDGEPDSTGYDSGSWPSKVFVSEKGEVKLRYSESVFYLKK